MFDSVNYAGDEQKMELYMKDQKISEVAKITAKLLDVNTE